MRHARDPELKNICEDERSVGDVRVTGTGVPIDEISDFRTTLL